MNVRHPMVALHSLSLWVSCIHFLSEIYIYIYIYIYWLNGINAFLFSCDEIYLKGVNISRGRSSHRRYSVRKGVVRNFAKLTGKHFPVNFAKFLRTPFYKTHLRDCFCRGLEEVILLWKLKLTILKLFRGISRMKLRVQ